MKLKEVANLIINKMNAIKYVDSIYTEKLIEDEEQFIDSSLAKGREIVYKNSKSNGSIYLFKTKQQIFDFKNNEILPEFENNELINLDLDGIKFITLNEFISLIDIDLQYNTLKLPCAGETYIITDYNLIIIPSED